MTQKERLDRLAELVKAVGPERMVKALVKSETVIMRVTLTDKEGMQRMASVCGLSVTEYLTRLHYLAEQGLVKLTAARKKAPGSRKP